MEGTGGSLITAFDYVWGRLTGRLSGLTDEEYFWEPVPGMWSVRPRGTSAAPASAGGGAFTMDWGYPEPEPAPVTTIAWRLCHLLAGVFTMRVASHFGGEPFSFDTFDYPGDAASALARLDTAYAAWNAGVRALTPEDLEAPLGPAEPHYSDYPMADLILHINREALHHGAEIALLRDLYRAQPQPAARP